MKCSIERNLVVQLVCGLTALLATACSDAVTHSSGAGVDAGSSTPPPAPPPSAPSGPGAPTAGGDASNVAPGDAGSATMDAAISVDSGVVFTFDADAPWDAADNPASPTPGPAACGGGTGGRSVGDVAENFTTYDQNGAIIQLSDYCSQWVYLEIGRMGCGACVSQAPQLQAAFVADKADNLMIFDALGRELNANPATGLIGTPTVADLMSWATTAGETLPVIADPNFEIFGRYWPFGAGTPYEYAWDWPQPQAILLKPGGIIVEIGQIPPMDLGQYVLTGQP